jgi:hypothetical protein
MWLWKIWMQRWKLIVPGKRLRENIKISAEESRLLRIEESLNGLTKDAQTYEIKGNKLNCGGYRIQVK